MSFIQGELREALEEDAALAHVAETPGLETSSNRYEGVGEIGGCGEGSAEWSVRVRRLSGVEAVPVDEAEESRPVEGAEVAEEGAVRDDAAEAGAGGAGPHEVRRGQQPEEDLLENLFGEERRRLDLRGRRRRRGHDKCQPTCDKVAERIFSVLPVLRYGQGSMIQSFFDTEKTM